MNKPNVVGRMVQWVIELSQFDIEYRPRTAIKVQALADFIVEFTLPDLDQEAEYWIVCSDGSSVIGLGVASVIMTSLENDILKNRVQLQFPATNNEAKYEAVLASLRVAKALGVKNLRLRTDSKLIVGQITNEYEAKEERMKKYLQLTSQLINEFDNINLKLIPREENSTVDQIARLASTEDTLAMVGLLMEVQTIPSIDKLQALSIQQPSNWMEPITSYIRDGQLPSDSSRAKKVRVRAARFIVFHGKLYKRGFLMPYLKCLTHDEAMYVIGHKLKDPL